MEGEEVYLKEDLEYSEAFFLSLFCCFYWLLVEEPADPCGWGLTFVIHIHFGERFLLLYCECVGALLYYGCLLTVFLVTFHNFRLAKSFRGDGVFVVMVCFLGGEIGTADAMCICQSVVDERDLELWCLGTYLTSACLSFFSRAA